MATKKASGAKKNASKRSRKSAVADRQDAASEYGFPMKAKTYVSPPINLSELEREFTRADLELEGIDHSQASYEARVFLNNPNASEDTAQTEAEGFAGTFHVFGHGGCYGDAGHCEIRGLPRLYDPRPSHPLSPLKKTVIATEAIRAALAKGSEVTVTIVPVVTGLTEKCGEDATLTFEKLSIITYL